ncbi:transmembrane protein 108-like [Megalops cyprinoides]|uniref:transmembrane protein 108-like n=1 Tax=Megalops cyprinoides TaxID=118141 RepID=UPI001864BAF9|nr:transmembrane protein 108-like [Megalops cyprinoides]XP_036375071.1 transmembrane protein 108-like [Megalops cyprinoides]XP_036375072.1 transmembrane protein 108-like [Megalops cyprinoides]
MKRSLQVLSCQLLSVLVILLLPAEGVSSTQERRVSRVPPDSGLHLAVSMATQSPTPTPSPDVLALHEGYRRGAGPTQAVSHTVAVDILGWLQTTSPLGAEALSQLHSPWPLSNLPLDAKTLLPGPGTSRGDMLESLGPVQVVSVEDPTDSGGPHPASKLRPNLSTTLEQEHRGLSQSLLGRARPHVIALREVHPSPSDSWATPRPAMDGSSTELPNSVPPSPSFSRTTAGSDITVHSTTDVPPINVTDSGTSLDNGTDSAPLPPPDGAPSPSRGGEPPVWDGSSTVGPTGGLLDRLFPAVTAGPGGPGGPGNHTDPSLAPPHPSPALCLSRVEVIWMVLAISVPVASCSVLLTVCCMRTRKKKKASGQESSLSYWNDAITMDYFSRHAVELPREIQPLETAEEQETFLSPNGDYVDNGMVLVNPFCQETLFISREKLYKS